MRILFLLFVTLVSFAQEKKIKTWADKDDFITSEIELSNNQYEYNEPTWSKINLQDLKHKYLNNQVSTKKISKEFREYYYQNFYNDKRLKKTIKDKRSRGFRKHSKDGNFGTLVYYQSNSNYNLLNNQTFEVKNIFSIEVSKFLEQTDDSNFIFELSNDKLGTIYYEFNTKFIDKVEIELVNLDISTQQNITGTITDDEGVPLPGVNVMIKGTDTGVASDFDGNYSIKAEEEDIIVFSFIGFVEQEIAVGMNIDINVLMIASL